MQNSITLKQIRAVNKRQRAKDDSHLYPIYGKFSVIERAIRQARRLMNANGPFSSEFEYETCLEDLCSRIVNDPKNQ